MLGHTVFACKEGRIFLQAHFLVMLQAAKHKSE